MALMTMTYLQAIMNMRVGLRLENTGVLLAAKSAFAPFFHARNHPKYRELEMIEAVQRCCVLETMLKFYNETETVSLSGDSNTGEGLDFKAEVVNRDVQAWMPRGVPEGKDCLCVTRNLDKLKKISNKCKDLYGLKKHRYNEGQHNVNISEHVTAWRVRLRETKYLLTPDQTKAHISINGKELDHSLINFQDIATKRRQQFFYAKYGALDDKCEDIPMVCVTKEERNSWNSLETQPKTVICDKIEGLISSVEDNEFRDSLLTELNSYRIKLSRTKRENLVLFHAKVQGVLKEQDIGNDLEICAESEN